MNWKNRLNAFVFLTASLVVGHTAQAQQISWPGAVVATKPGSLYYGDDEKPVAAITPGEKFCVIDAFPGQYGELVVQLPNGEKLGADNTPAAFLPDDTNPLCRAAREPVMMKLQLKIDKLLPFMAGTSILSLLYLGLMCLCLAAAGFFAFNAFNAFKARGGQ